MKSLTYVCALALAAGVGLGPAVADYPEKPITLVVNFGAGSTTDIVARLLAERAAKELGGTIAVANHAGAGGTVGIAQVARSSPDGYTIGTANMPTVSIIPQMRSVPYDPKADLVQIASVLPYEYATIARVDAPYSNWDEFIKYVKSNPGKVTFGGLGRGTTDHITMERIARDLDLDWKYVPFKGSDNLVTALLGGHVDVINSTVGPVTSSIRANKIRPLIVNSEVRLKELAPDVPTMAEAGFKHSQVSYMSIIAPAGISAEVRAKLEKAFKTAVEDPEVLAAANKLLVNLAFIPGVAYEARLETLRGEFAPLLEELGLSKAK